MMHCIALRPHVTDGGECWCAPEVMEPCPECEEPPSPACWRCGGRGLIEHSGDPTATTLTLHNIEPLHCAACGSLLDDDSWPARCSCGAEHLPAARLDP